MVVHTRDYRVLRWMSSIYIVQRYGVPIFFGSIPASTLNFELDQPLIAAGLYSLHRFGLRDATTRVLRMTLLYKSGDATTLTFNEYVEEDILRRDYDALDDQKRLSERALGEQKDSLVNFELDVQGIAIDFQEIDISEPSLRTLAFLNGMLSTMSSEFQRDIINQICRRGLSYTQYSRNFERRMQKVLQRVAEDITTTRKRSSGQLLRDYEKILALQVVNNPKLQKIDVTTSLDRKVDFGVSPTVLPPLIIASKNMLSEIFEPLYGLDLEYMIIDLENDHRVFIAYRNSSSNDLYSVQVYRTTKHVSSYAQEISILEDVRVSIPDF